MENQSPTPEKSKALQSSNDIKVFLSQSKNYILIGLMMTVTMLLNLVTIRGGEDGLASISFPTSPLGWFILVAQSLLAAIASVLIMYYFRGIGIDKGKKTIQSIIDKYYEAIGPKEKKAPRSVNKYKSSEAAKDFATKFPMIMGMTMITTSIMINFHTSGIISAIISLCMAIAFGINNMNNAEEYMLDEGRRWYVEKTRELNELRADKEDKEVSNGN